MNQDNIVRKAVALTRNAHADKCVRPENVEADAIQAIVWKVNCAKKELVLLAVEIIWIVRVTERVWTSNALIHALVRAVKMPFAEYPIIVWSVCVPTDIVVNRHKVAADRNAQWTAIVKLKSDAKADLVEIHAYKRELAE